MSIALITGGATGIGAATARLLAKEGAQVAICDVDPERGRATADEINGIFIQCDVSNYGEIENAVKTCLQQLGVPDLVLLNAGIMTAPAGADFVEIEAVDLSRYKKIVGVNISGVFYGLKALLPHMRSKGGVVTVTGSLAAVAPLPQDPLYSMTKHALAGLIRSVAAASDDAEVRINMICPGVVDTDIVPDALRGPHAMPVEEMAIEVMNFMRFGSNGEIRGKVGGKPSFELKQPELPI